MSFDTFSSKRLKTQAQPFTPTIQNYLSTNPPTESPVNGITTQPDIQHPPRHATCALTRCSATWGFSAKKYFSFGFLWYKKPIPPPIRHAIRTHFHYPPKIGVPPKTLILIQVWMNQKARYYGHQAHVAPQRISAHVTGSELGR